MSLIFVTIGIAVVIGSIYFKFVFNKKQIN